MDAQPWVAGYFGPMYWGKLVNLNYSLVGTTMVQAYVFFTRSKDKWPLQLVVHVLPFYYNMLFDLASTILMSITVFQYFVSLSFSCSSQVPIISKHRSWCTENGITALVTCITQLFFATRISFGESYHSCETGSVFNSVPTSYAAVRNLKHIISALYQRLSWQAYKCWQVTTCLEDGSAAVSDVLTTGTLCFILFSARGGIKRTKSPIRRLFFFILNRGILVTILQVSMLVSYVTARSYLYWMPFHLCKSKLYTNTLCAYFSPTVDNSTLIFLFLSGSSGYVSCVNSPHRDVLRTTTYQAKLPGLGLDLKDTLCATEHGWYGCLRVCNEASFF
ncbi:hypothetical protein HYDPIDRAFT_92942 [Hydnomerulius pinastri MD-312]|uniref:DUF6534 domain-containing protein n=1 Tax=Hydnomerulius pinastri MD-312 TaxID=994086 RepID=A0A0C9WDM4_9AGAM|nr:hypothetical protein HYDPIDRAFT_92942 [Hydnomerulius pinastri MD-312]